MDNRFVSEFSFTPGEYGWTGRFPNGPYHLFGKEIGLEIHTRQIPQDPKILPEATKNQTALVCRIASNLPAILKRSEAELTAYNQESDPTFLEFIRHPHVWLDCERDAPLWTFVVGRADNPDFGYHLEFSDSEFLEIWAGD
jgi:hypothetical protein